MKPSKWSSLIAITLMAPLLSACNDTKDKAETRTEAKASTKHVKVHPRLHAHSKVFKKEIVNPAKGVYVAVGYGLANSIMVEGKDGVIIIDTMESRSSAEAVFREFRKITDKPVKGIILTHNHTDHIYGSQVFAEGRNVPVYAHRDTSRLINKIINVLSYAIYARSMRMFGNRLNDEEFENAGIGPRLTFKTEDMALMRPTHVFDDELDITIAGVRIKLVHAPGETDDQLFVWLPDHKILAPGDNIYKTFPNLYTIRGTAYRDVMKWALSIDKMRALKPEIIVPSHTRPIVGAKKVQNILTAYRDAIQYVHDQTVRGMNKGMTPDEIVDFVKLPQQLSSHPWLTEHYGTVAWSTRSVFNGYLGWFSGDAVDLYPLSPEKRAKKMASAFSAGKSLPEQAREAVANNEYQWAAELTRFWINSEPESREAKELQATIFTRLGRRNINPNARHWFITQAKELRGELDIGKPDPSLLPDDVLATFPIDSFMAGMASRLKAEEAVGKDQIVQFTFTDLNRKFTVHLRNGVAAPEIAPSRKPDLEIRVSSQVWKKIASKKRNPALAYASGEIEIEGGVIGVVRFLSLFER